MRFPSPADYWRRTWREHQAIIMTEHTAGGQPLPSARTFELDDNGKIQAERVVFFGLAV